MRLLYMRTYLHILVINISGKFKRPTKSSTSVDTDHECIRWGKTFIVLRSSIWMPLEISGAKVTMVIFQIPDSKKHTYFVNSGWNLPVSSQTHHYIETSHLICSINQFTSFYIISSLTKIWLMHHIKLYHMERYQ